MERLIKRLVQDIKTENLYSTYETSEEECYFNIPIRKKVYPSCYQYNVLIMLAKRLIEKEENTINICQRRRNLFGLRRY